MEVSKKLISKAFHVGVVPYSPQMSDLYTLVIHRWCWPLEFEGEPGSSHKINTGAWVSGKRGLDQPGWRRSSGSSSSCLGGKALEGFDLLAAQGGRDTSPWGRRTVGHLVQYLKVIQLRDDARSLLPPSWEVCPISGQQPGSCQGGVRCHDATPKVPCSRGQPGLYLSKAYHSWRFSAVAPRTLKHD